LDAWTRFTERMGELDALQCAAGLLEWDQQTYMPEGGATSRGESIAALAGMHHRLSTDDAFGGCLAELERSVLDATQAAAVRVAGRRYRRATALPGRLVSEQALARSVGYTAWIEARRTGDVGPYLRALQRIMDLAREQANLQGGAHPYDAVLEDFDPGSTVAELAPMFSRLGGATRELLDAIDGRPGPEPLREGWDLAGQRALSDRVLADLGFDGQRGRMDLSAHPFTMGLHPADVRLTTHFREDSLLAGLGSTIHECGHGLYEQGLPAELSGTGLDRAAGAGLHESQSRCWENVIGRSMPFCRYLARRMHETWPGCTVTALDLYGACNRVERSLVRIYADEVTYNLHIIARFELELAIFEGRLGADGLPAAWDEAYSRLLGVRPPSDREGVLQDIHWASGLFGYFPSYTIGNLYAASLGAAMEVDLPGMWDRVEAGDFREILAWLRDRVHRHGATCDAPEIVRRAVGERDAVADLVAYTWRRHGALYGASQAPVAQRQAPSQ
jgi:carboxypeptidase Taq